MNEDDALEAAALLRALLEAVERGELTAPAVVLAYLEGVLSALEASTSVQ